MSKNREVGIIVFIGIIVFWFLEVFINWILYLNAVIFLEWKHLDVVIFWIIIYLTLIFGTVFIFSQDFIKGNLRFNILLILIIVSRILTQFYFVSEIHMLFLCLLFISMLLFSLELFNMLKKSENINDYQLITGGIILGLSTLMLLLIINFSSNLTTDFIKFPITLVFCIGLLYFRKDLLEIEEKFSIKNRKEEGTISKNELGLIHFFLFGLLFFLILTWTFNPMALSAYDGESLNYFYYGYIYYAILIVISSLISFFLIRNVISKNNRDIIKRSLLLANIAFCIINCLAYFIIENDNTFISPLYLTCLTFIGVFTILFNISFIIHFYSPPSRIKSHIGILIFIISITLSYSVQIIFTWSLYQTLFYSISIISILQSILLYLKEIKQIQTLSINKPEFINVNKQCGIIFLILFAGTIVSFIGVSLTQNYNTPSDGKPTIMVWNIHNGIGLDDKFDLDRICDEIQEYEPDILGLNEVDKGSIKTSTVDIASYMAKKLDMYYYYGPSFFKHYGNAILSKYPIKNAKAIRLPRVSTEEPRCVIQAKIKIEDEIWTIYVNHLATNEPDRLKQVPYIVNLIEDQEDFERVVWMGDFNARPSTEPIEKVNDTSDDLRFIDSHKYLDSTPGNTGGFNYKNRPTNRIDYIFCSPDLTPKKAYVHCSIASDHCAIITKF